MYRKYDDNDSSDEEGFQSSEIRIVDMPIQQIVQNVKVGGAKQLIAKKFTYVCSSIYTSINLITYPYYLYQNVEDAIIKMEKQKAIKENQQEKQGQLKELGEFLKGMECIYNKFDTKLDFKADMTSMYKSFENQVVPISSLYKQFIGKDYPSEQDIEFSSNFESGNLQFVFVSESNTYYLLLKNDINTKGFNSWFYFRIRNKKKCKVKLIILNISRPVTLMKNAMGVSVFSMQQRSFCRKYWTQGGTNIKLYKNKYRRKTKNSKNNQFYTLQFDYQFKFQSDNVYFAMNTPFTYTKLLNSIDDITKYKKQKITINIKVLGKTVSNNTIHALQFSLKNNNKSLNLEALKISASTVAQQQHMKQLIQSNKVLSKKKRKSIIFIGRQHPYQTNSSFVLQGIINFLSEQNDTTLFLLENYDFYIIPISNPDGVVHGHSRTNLCGYDINRQWHQSNEERSKQTFLISEYIKELNINTNICYAIDFQSHHKKLNTFGYFCQNSLETKAFAWYLQDSNTNFSYQSCTFGKNKGKQKSFRTFAYNLGINNSITIQTSFFGKLEHGLYRKYNTKQLRDLGVNIIKAIGQFSEEGVTQVIINNFIQSNVSEVKNEEQLSQSDPEGDYLEERQRVRIILDARRQIQSSKPKGYNKSISFERPKPLNNLSLMNKTSLRFERTNSSKVQSPTFPASKTYTTSFSVSPTKAFKPYSREQILRDDSQHQDLVLSPKRRLKTQTPNRTPSRIYLWDQSKYRVNKLISYPTTLQPYLQRISSFQVNSNPIIKKRRVSSATPHSITTQINLQKSLLDRRKNQNQKIDLMYSAKKKRGRYLKKIFPCSLIVHSHKNLNY